MILVIPDDALADLIEAAEAAPPKQGARALWTLAYGIGPAAPQYSSIVDRAMVAERIVGVSARLIELAAEIRAATAAATEEPAR